MSDFQGLGFLPSLKKHVTGPSRSLSPGLTYVVQALAVPSRELMPLWTIFVLNPGISQAPWQIFGAVFPRELLASNYQTPHPKPTVLFFIPGGRGSYIELVPP